MRKNVLVSGCCILVLFLISACEAVKLDKAEDQDYYLKLYGSYYDEVLTDVWQADENELFLVGYREAYGQEPIEAWMSKFDASGMQVKAWDKHYSGQQNIRMHEVWIGESLVVIAGSVDRESSAQTLFINSYTGDGERIDSVSWLVDAKQILDVEFLSSAEDIKFLVHARMSSVNEDLFYIGQLLDGHFKMLSVNRLYNVLDGRLYLYENGKNGVYVAANIKETAVSEFTDISLTYIEDDNLMWSYRYGDENRNEFTSGIEICDDKICIGTSFQDEKSNHQLCLLKTDLNGINDEALNLLLEDNCKAFGFDRNRKGEFVFVGVRKPYVTDVNLKQQINEGVMFFIKCDALGNVLCDETFGSKGLSSGSFLFESENDDAYFTAGNLDNGPNQDVIVVKMNDEGEWY